MDGHVNEISDGRIYRKNDMVRAGCHECAGCSDCCREMGESIVLNPHDVFRLGKTLHMDFSGLLERHIGLHVEDGLILPHLRMEGAKGNQKCTLLNGEGRCSVHASRPGICRLFPLGRQYEEDEISYFLLKDACPAKNKSKVRVEKWLDMPDLPEYERFLLDWHRLLKSLREELAENGDADGVYQKQVGTMFLRLFYQKPYGEFFREFYERRELLIR